jgi:hypothetical protein
MLQKVLDSMNKEYETLESLLDPINGADWALDNPMFVIKNAEHRVVGVCMFAPEYLDVDYNDINPLFEEWVKKVHTLKKKVVDNKNKI